MSRPQPKILLEQQLMNDQTWQVLDAEAYFIITYKGRAINLRVVTYDMDGPNLKYKKLTYAHLGSAMRQAQLLNRRFNCEDFDVMQVDL